MQGGSVAVALALVVAITMPVSAETIITTIENLSFNPAEMKAKAGDTILWANKDVLDHTATARDNSFDTIQPAKSSVPQTLTRAGIFDYYCRYHPNMMGRLMVEP